MVVGQGNVRPTTEVRPPPPGSQQQSMNAAGVAAPSSEGQQRHQQASPKLPSPGKQNTEVLNQTRRLSVCPAKVAAGGLAIATIGYFVLYSNKKPEATALDVAKVATGTATPANTRPRN